eukprot:700308-Alexandrium_andersonii.AAC.1
MSASLVGSEMCIRDRREIPRRRDAATLQEAPTSLRRCDAARSPPDAATPVSYTHLTLPTICSV